MKPAQTFAKVSRRFYRAEQSHCPICQRRLRRAVTLSQRTVITLDEVIKLVHAGYRCPDPHCAGSQRTYRSVKADALALPWFTYGLDIVLLVGRLRLREHRTVDEIHQELLRRLEPLGVKIARREILYLFEAYCTLLRASSSAKDDVEWLAQVEKNGGIIVSLDGIQPEKGNETVYLVRDALTGRVLAAENVTSSETAVMKALHWLLEVEHLLDESLVPKGEVVSNVTVGNRLDRWREHMSTHLTDGSLSQLEHECLREFLQVLSNLRSHLVQCYDHQDFPRTNNDMERSIRGLKMQYRRVSGRKNWNAYLLRHGRCVAYAAWWEQDVAHRQHLEQQAARLDRTRWRELRRESSRAYSEQLTRFRFRHKRQALLASLEARWAVATQSVPLP